MIKKGFQIVLFFIGSVNALAGMQLDNPPPPLNFSFRRVKLVKQGKADK